MTVGQVRDFLGRHLPPGWGTSVWLTKHTLQINAHRMPRRAVYHLTTNRLNPLPDLREFVAACRVLAGLPPLEGYGD